MALFSVLAMPIVPFIWAAAPAVSRSGIGPAAVTPFVSVPAAWWTSGTLVIALWALWSLVYSGRIACAVVALRRARSRWRELPEDRERQLRHWSEIKRRGRGTRMVLSESVRSAAVLGCGSPVIAIAPELIDQMSADELDRVVVHEWAHVQRRDDFANVVQLCLRLVAGWHPAVWWLDRQLRVEREAACDEIAVVITGRAKAYAECLAKLASLPSRPVRPLPDVAAVSSASALRRRIVRILAQRHIVSPRSSRLASTGVGCSLCALALIVASIPAIEAAASLDIDRAASFLDYVVTPERAQASGLAARPIPAASAQSNRVLQASRSTRIESGGAGPVGRSGSTGGVLASAPWTSFDPAPVPVEAPAPSRDLIPASLSLPTLRSSASPEAAHGYVAVSVPAEEDRSPWRAIADGGVAVGRGSQKAAEATAGFFSRFGKNVAGAF
jgi:beta-lactamase regulating signal transducer with metallopeptidase domain